MQQFRDVLVGVPTPSIDADGNVVPNAPAEAALQQALQLARSTGCKLKFMSVVDPPSAGLLTSDEEDRAFARKFMDEAQAALMQLVEGLDVSGIALSCCVVQGQAWHAMCQAVLEHGHDLVIAGTRNVSALKRLLFGGTGLKLLRHCPCPVWIVKPREEETGAMDILVASQLDEVGKDALSLAVGGASFMDARVHVLHAIDIGSARQLGLNAEEMAQHREKIGTERENKLQEQIADTDHRTTPYGVDTLVVTGRPYVCILDAIAEKSVDLVVMGTAGRGGLSGALVGNTAEHLLTEIPCSILAIKPDDFVCPVKLESTTP